MAESRTVVSDDSQRQIEELAREQNRAPCEVLDEAVRRYAASQRLERFSDKMERMARARGIREEDVPRLIEDVRRENQTRER